METVRIDERDIVRLRERPIGVLTATDAAVVDADCLGSYANRWLCQHGYRIEWRSGVASLLEQHLTKGAAPATPKKTSNMSMTL